MPDAPDWYRYQRESTRHIMGDLGELAARLGSPVVYDRRGTVVWVWDGRYGITTFNRTGGGDGNNTLLGSAYSGFGGFTLRMIAGSTDSWLSEVTKFFNPFDLDRWGLEMSISYGNAFERLSFYFQYTDATYRYEGVIRLHDTDNKIYYKDFNGDDQEITDLSKLDDSYGIFYTMKMVIDLETKEYVRFIFNQTEHDLEGVALYRTSASDNLSSKIGATLIGIDETNSECSIDYMIVTTGEP